MWPEGLSIKARACWKKAGADARTTAAMMQPEFWLAQFGEDTLIGASGRDLARNLADAATRVRMGAARPGVPAQPTPKPRRPVLDDPSREPGSTPLRPLPVPAEDVTDDDDPDEDEPEADDPPPARRRARPAARSTVEAEPDDPALARERARAQAELDAASGKPSGPRFEIHDGDPFAGPPPLVLGGRSDAERALRLAKLDPQAINAGDALALHAGAMAFGGGRWTR